MLPTRKFKQDSFNVEASFLAMLGINKSCLKLHIASTVLKINLQERAIAIIIL